MTPTKIQAQLASLITVKRAEIEAARAKVEQLRRDCVAALDAINAVKKQIPEPHVARELANYIKDPAMRDIVLARIEELQGRSGVCPHCGKSEG